MTLVGVGALVPGLPTLLTNLIHQGSKSTARSSTNTRRRGFIARHAGAFRKFALLSATDRFGITSTEAALARHGVRLPAWALVALEFADDVAKALSLAVAVGGEAGLSGGAGTGDGPGGGGSGGTAADALTAFRTPSSPLEEYTSGECVCVCMCMCVLFTCEACHRKRGTFHVLFSVSGF